MIGTNDHTIGFSNNAERKTKGQTPMNTALCFDAKGDLLGMIQQVKSSCFLSRRSIWSMIVGYTTDSHPKDAVSIVKMCHEQIRDHKEQ